MDPERGAVGGCRARFSRSIRAVRRAASFASSPTKYGVLCRHGRGENNPPFEPETHPDCPGAGSPPVEREVRLMSSVLHPAAPGQDPFIAPSHHGNTAESTADSAAQSAVAHSAGAAP